MDHDYTVTDDDVMNGNWIYFYDENWTEAGICASDFGGSGTVIPAADLANALANAINSYGLNAYADVTGDGELTIRSYVPGPLSAGWNFDQGFGTATYSETDGIAPLPPGDFIVTNLANLGDATGYQAIGDTVDFLSGYGAPTLDIGEEGNGYVDQNNGDFYHRDASGWQFVLNIRGPQGPQGTQGTQGPSGKDGANAMRVSLGDSTQVGTLLWKCKPPTASNGAVAGTYATDSNPAGICFDGTNIWVANCNYTTQSLSKFVAATGVLVGTYSYLWNLNSPLGICFDGTNIWTANSGSFGVAKIAASTAAFVWEHFTDTDPPYWVCFDGTYLWATYQAGTIRKLSPSDASVMGRYKAGSGPRGICFDGTYIWVANYFDNTVSRL